MVNVWNQLHQESGPEPAILTPPGCGNNKIIKEGYLLVNGSDGSRRSELQAMATDNVPKQGYAENCIRNQ
jgi:hypothetical protein